MLVSVKDGKLDRDKLERVGKMLYRLKNILVIYADKKGREHLTEEQFIQYLTGFITEAKEYYK